MRRSITRATFVAGAAAALTACHGGFSDVVSVGSKEFTEELLLGEMYAQLLEHHGLTVRRRLGLGGTAVATAALRRGSIDLYPEYTGTALLVELHEATIRDEAALYAEVKREYERRYGLVWLQQTPMNDTQALAITPALAAREHLRTLSDLAAAAPHLRLGAIPEFLDRADGLPGLRRAYGGFQFRETRLLDIGVKYRALLAGDVDVVVAFSTDGRIAADHLVVLRDDKHFWPAYHVAPVVRRETLARKPQIAGILDALAPHLTDDVMRGLNERIDGDKQETEDVARDFLTRAKLLEA